MISGDPLLDALAYVAIGWVGAILILPICRWIEYKCDCKKYGKEKADEIWRRM